MVKVVTRARVAGPNNCRIVGSIRAEAEIGSTIQGLSQALSSGAVIAAVIGVVVAAVGSLFWVIRGKYVANLTIELSIKRYSGTGKEDQDHLICEIALKKEDTALVTLKNIKVVVEDLTKKETGTTISEEWLEEDLKKSNGKMLKLPPGEAIQLSHRCSVPSRAVCKVKVRVYGKTWGTRTEAEWIATGISLPVESR
jgi:hypothetical protein